MRSSILFGLALLAACGGDPEGPAIIVGPAGANTFDDLWVQVDDDKPDKYSYQWQRDGEDVEGLTEMTLPSSETRKGDEWTVVVTKGNKTATASLVVGNAPPSGEVTISPAAPTADDDITATGKATDPDGDPAYVEYRWDRYDEESGEWEGSTFTNRTLPASATRRGQRWRCIVIPLDGDDQGATGYVEFTIANGLPIVTRAEVNRSSASTNDTLSVTAEAEDPDGDAVTIEYQWVINGVEVDGQTTSIFDGSGPDGFDAGDEVYVKVRGNDGEPGPWRASPVVQVVNGAPSAPTLEVTPAEPLEDEDLKCSVVDAAVDPDPGDKVTYRAEWTVNGAPFTGGSTVDLLNDTVPAELTEPGDTWTCRLVASDALGNESYAMGSVEVSARSGCVDGTTEVEWNVDTIACAHTEAITWKEAAENTSAYCASGWEMADSSVVNSILNGPGYTDDWNFAFNGDGCSGRDTYATTNDSSTSSNKSCVWRTAHFKSLSSEDSEVDGVMCVRAPAEE